MEMAKKGRGVESLEIKGARERTGDLGEAMLEGVEDLLPWQSRPLTLEEVLEKAGPCVGWWKICERADERGFEVQSGQVVLLTPFLVDELEDRVGKGGFRRKLLGGIADGVQVNHPGVAEKAERATH